MRGAYIAQTMAISDPSATLASASVHALWSVRLLGAVRASSATQTLSHWPSRAVAMLLARLAMTPARAHPREELVELLWPGVALDIGRNRLRQALSTLKRLLEPAGAQAPAVLLADRMNVRVVPGSLRCDALSFEQSLRAGDSDGARALYRGEFMPGFYEDWVGEERRRLATLFDRLEAVPALPAAPSSGHPAAPAAGRTSPPEPSRMPSYWTRLFGVEHSAARLRALVCAHRLVAVCGAGGSGKTRLAVEVAQALSEPSAWSPADQAEHLAFDRIAFVSLVDCRESGHAVDAIAAALGVAGRDPLARLTEALWGRRTLLLLDNFEQLVGRADDILLRLLSDVPSLHLLVTTRRRLGLDGEQTFELNGLLLPKLVPKLVPNPESQAGQPAVALFMDRARAARADFQASAAEAPAIAELVRLLAGMPLAIELAATRMRSMAPRELLKLLTEDHGSPMLELLARTGPASSGERRHASMRFVVAWSWQQLPPAQLNMLQTMAAFGAPARIETVAAVAGTDERAALAQLEALRDNSLVQAADGGGGGGGGGGPTRYVLLQPVREFVVERAEDDAGRAARSRLRDYLTEQGQWLGRPGTGAATLDDLPHVLAAILSAPADGAGQQAVALAVAWRRYWEVETLSALPLSVMQLLEQEQLHTTDPGLRSEVCALLSSSRQTAGFGTEAVALAEMALAHAPDARRRSLALMRWAVGMSFSGGLQAELDAPLDEALALARQGGDVLLQALAFRALAMVAVNKHADHARGERLSAQAQALWEQLGDRRNAYRRLQDRAICWAWMGRNDEAATALAACEQAAVDDGDYAGQATAAWQLGRVLVRLRQAEPAVAAFQRSIDSGWRRHIISTLTATMLVVASAVVLTGQTEKAARLLGFGMAHWLRTSGPLNRVVEPEIRRTRRLLRKALGPARAEALRLEGAGLSLAQAVALALG